MADVKPFYDFLQAAGSLSREAFLELHTRPFLHFHSLPDLAASAVFSTIRLTPGQQAPQDLGQQAIAPLVKGSLNAFSMMVTLGRAENNDVVIPDKNVSKFHAWIAPAGEGWTITDANSTNGTRLDNLRLEPGKATTLRSGAQLEFAERARATFLLPTDLFELVQGARAWVC